MRPTAVGGVRGTITGAVPARERTKMSRAHPVGDLFTRLPVVGRFPHLLTGAAWLVWTVIGVVTLTSMWGHPAMPGGLVGFASGMSVLLGVVMFVWVTGCGEKPLQADPDSVRVIFVLSTVGHATLVLPHMLALVPLYVAYLSGYFWYPHVFQRAATVAEDQRRAKRAAASAAELAPVFDQRRRWGRPGANLATATDPFGVSRSEPGAVGEPIGGSKLEEILPTYQDAYVFHSLRFPGSAVADVDHAVVRGQQVVLVDSKSWKPGRYSWDHHGALLRDGEHFKGGTNHLADAVSGYRTALYDNPGSWSGTGGDRQPARVCGLVLLTAASDGGRFTVDNTGAPAGVQLTTLDQVQPTLQNILSGSGERNLMILEHLRNQLV